MSNFRTFPVVVSALIAATSCDPAASPGPGSERSDEDGIELVTIRGPDTSLGWTFETVLTIPPELDGEVRFTEVSPWEVGADEDGRLYVLDDDGGRVVVFGRSGREVGSVGRPGREPDELSEPVALAVTAAGEVAVVDYAAGGIMRWGSAGGLPSIERLETNFWGPELRAASWGILHPSLASDGRDGRVVQLVVAAETRTGVLAEMTQKTVTAAFPNCGISGIPVEPIFEPHLLWDLGGDIVAVATGPGYEIEVFRRGVMERRIVREKDVRPVDRDLALQEVGDGLELTAPVRCRVSPAELVDARGFADAVPSISGIAVAPDGSIWVRRAAVAGEGIPAVDVLGPDGDYLGTLPTGSPFPAAFAGRATDYRAVSLRSADTGATEIVVSRIVR
ncbi:MAG: hypothetical protein KJO44_07820 [Gemmatimonadetes bacterium]|nr:hypothetical protein [Gemmatimonadota bacterium]